MIAPHRSTASPAGGEALYCDPSGRAGRNAGSTEVKTAVQQQAHEVEYRIRLNGLQLSPPEKPGLRARPEFRPFRRAGHANGGTDLYQVRLNSSAAVIPEAACGYPGSSQA
jgi:hypothetical protein